MRTATDFDRGLTIPEAAERLGLKEATLRAWILHRKISYRKIGRAVRIPLSEVERINQESLIPARNVR